MFGAFVLRESETDLLLRRHRRAVTLRRIRVGVIRTIPRHRPTSGWRAPSVAPLTGFLRLRALRRRALRHASRILGNRLLLALIMCPTQGTTQAIAPIAPIPSISSVASIAVGPLNQPLGTRAQHGTGQ